MQAATQSVVHSWRSGCFVACSSQDADAVAYRALVELAQFFSDDQTLRDRRKQSTGTRRSQRLEPVQLDAGPLEAALLQDVARGRVGDAGAARQRLVVERFEEMIDHRARGFGAEALAPMLDAKPVAEFRRVSASRQSMPTMPIGAKSCSIRNTISLSLEASARTNSTAWSCG